MNAGVIASRYAKALLKYVMETGNGDEVYSQACVIVLRMKEVKPLCEYLESRNEIGLEDKVHLLETALGEPVASEIRDFVSLVDKRGRSAWLLRMFHSFISQYRDFRHIKVGRLVTARPAEGLEEKLEEMIRKQSGSEVHLQVSIDPAITGGFVFELGDWRVDASVERQFKLIRERLVDKNNRIV